MKFLTSVKKRPEGSCVSRKFRLIRRACLLYHLEGHNRHHNNDIMKILDLSEKAGKRPEGSGASRKLLVRVHSFG